MLGHAFVYCIWWIVCTIYTGRLYCRIHIIYPRFAFWESWSVQRLVVVWLYSEDCFLFVCYALKSLEENVVMNQQQICAECSMKLWYKITWVLARFHVLTRSKPIFYRRMSNVRILDTGRGFASWNGCWFWSWKCYLLWQGCSSGSGACSWRISGDVAVGQRKDQVKANCPCFYTPRLSCVSPDCVPGSVGSLVSPLVFRQPLLPLFLILWTRWKTTLHSVSNLPFSTFFCAAYERNCKEGRGEWVGG